MGDLIYKQQRRFQMPFLKKEEKKLTVGGVVVVNSDDSFHSLKLPLAWLYK